MKEITQGELLLYQDEKGSTQIEVRLENENVWLTQAQLVTLYQSSKANVSEHIEHIFEEGELEEMATIRKFRTVAFYICRKQLMWYPYFSQLIL